MKMVLVSVRTFLMLKLAVNVKTSKNVHFRREIDPKNELRGLQNHKAHAAQTLIFLVKTIQACPNTP